MKFQLVDKITLGEFINLPGIISDRFFTLMGVGSKSDGRVSQEKFVNTLITVYSSALEDKMQLVFNIFDFDCDGKISAEDVRLVLSYIPIRRNTSSLTVDDLSLEREDCSSKNSKQEGLYNRSDGKDMNDEERGSNQKQIKQFVSLVFDRRLTLTLKEFIEFNLSVSSEMFISVISIIQERLPCSSYVFRQKKLFKTAEFLRNQKLLVNQNRSPTDDDDSLVAKAEEMCLSPLRALPNPKMLQGWQAKVQQSLFKPESLPSTMSASSS